MAPQPDFEQLFSRAKRELARGADRGASLQLVASLLQREVAHYDWFGFYIAVPSEQMLVLGPFEGKPTEHLRIPYGRGICGQAAERLQTFLVDDVAAQDNYLACSLEVKSEIVVPVFRDGEFVAEIDIDSHRVAAFDDTDQRFLERLAAEVAAYVDFEFQITDFRRASSDS